MQCRYCRRPLEKVTRDTEAPMDVRALFEVLAPRIGSVYVLQGTTDRACPSRLDGDWPHEPQVLITVEVWPVYPSALSCRWCAEPMTVMIAGDYQACNAHALWGIEDITKERLRMARITAP